MGYYEDQQERRRRDEEDARNRVQQRQLEEKLERDRFIRSLCGCGLAPKAIGGVCTICWQKQQAAEARPDVWPLSEPSSYHAEEAARNQEGYWAAEVQRYDAATDAEARAAEFTLAQGRIEASGELERLWAMAVRGCDDEQLQVRRYWMLINEAETADANRARELLYQAGYELGRGSEAARQTGAARELAQQVVDDCAPRSEGCACVGCGSFLTAVGDLCLSCAVRARDGDDVRSSDAAYPGVAERQRSVEYEEWLEERRVQHREVSNLCLNLDGQAVVGRLCNGCAAQVRREEEASPRYQEAYARTFAETDELRTLWERARYDPEGQGRPYDEAREQFWELVSSAPEPEARFARHMLQAAGYDMKPGQAPILRMDTGDRRPGRNRADRLLSLEHANPQSRARELSTDPANIRFMHQRDNAARGNTFTAGDSPVMGWVAFWERKRRR